MDEQKKSRTKWSVRKGRTQVLEAVRAVDGWTGEKISTVQKRASQSTNLSSDKRLDYNQSNLHLERTWVVFIFNSEYDEIYFLKKYVNENKKIRLNSIILLEYDIDEYLFISIQFEFEIGRS